MAKIEFTGFVEEVKSDWLLKTAEPHRKQVDGKWETVGRTFRTVKAAYGTTQDFSTLSKGDRVEIIGTEVTESREYQGKKYYDLVVKADTVRLADRGPVAYTPPVGTSTVDTFPPLDDSAPF